jgi:hypothetical protein
MYVMANVALDGSLTASSPATAVASAEVAQSAEVQCG